MLMWIAGIGAAVCLVYYIVITIYAGFAVSFSWFWLLAAGGLSLISWGSRYSRLHPRKIPMWVGVPALTCLAAAAVVFLAVELCVFLGAAVNEEQGLDYVIVLGAKVHKQGISNSLRKRLDKVLAYSGRSPGTVFILSGGQGPDEPVTEAQAMYDYLVEHGMSEVRGRRAGALPAGGGETGADRSSDQQLPCIQGGHDREEAGDHGYLRDLGAVGSSAVRASVRAGVRGGLKGSSDGKYVICRKRRRPSGRDGANRKDIEKERK